MRSSNAAQGLLIHGRTYGFARYFFLQIVDPSRARGWRAFVADQVTTAAPWTDMPPSTLYIGFSYNGLSALGVAESSLASFPDDFKQGMAARARTRLTISAIATTTFLCNSTLPIPSLCPLPRYD